MKIIGVTGQRASIEDNEGVSYFFHFLFWRKRYVTARVIHGMCDGPDLHAANNARLVGIKVTGVRPWNGHKVSFDWQRDYEVAMKLDEIITLNQSDDFPGNQCYFVRNDYIVNHSDIIVSVWDESIFGGTYYTVNRAVSLGKKVYNFNWKTGESYWIN